MPPMNGNWTKGAIAGVAFSIGIAGGALGAGLWAGTIQSDLMAHKANGQIHQTTEEKEAATRRVIDREVNPQLVAIQKQLDRIERVLAEVQRERRGG